MAKAQLTKIRLTGLKKHYKLLMQELHKSGSLQVVRNEAFVGQSTNKGQDHFGVFDLARIEFAIDFLTPYAAPMSKLDSLLAGGKLVLSEREAKERLNQFSPQSEALIAECEVIEERLVKLQNELAKIPQQTELLDLLHGYKGALRDNFQTQTTRSFIGRVPTRGARTLASSVSEVSNLVDVSRLGHNKLWSYFRITCDVAKMSEFQAVLNDHAFEIADLGPLSPYLGQTVSEIKKALTQQKKAHKAELKTLDVRCREIASHLGDFKILFDYNDWKKTKNDLQKDIFLSENAFAFEAWCITESLDDFHKWIENAFVGGVSIESIEREEGEEPPTLLQNRMGVRSFQAITEMYGLPRFKEFDPTPFLAPFFFIFFGLCLSDVGYGLILLLVSTWFLIFGTFSAAAKDSLRLLWLCGLAALLGGVILGGYFGMTVDQFTLLANPNNPGYFYGQLLNPIEGNGSTTFLLAAIALGAVHLLFGLVLAFVQRWSQKRYMDAICDPASWFVFLLAIAGFGFADLLGWDKALMQNILIGVAIWMVWAQSRSQKNWLLKPIIGVLGLYNITGYLSDLLSYSRVMALGLATGVVAFAMNTTAGVLGDMVPIPALAVLVSVIVILIGHTLNFAVSLLGAFIHSARLQFIEFFGKFYEGGSDKFEPLARKGKYLFFRG